LDVALTIKDYRVTVDDVPCPVQLLTHTLLSCNVETYTFAGVDDATVKVSQPLYRLEASAFCLVV